MTWTRDYEQMYGSRWNCLFSSWCVFWSTPLEIIAEAQPCVSLPCQGQQPASYLSLFWPLRSLRRSFCFGSMLGQIDPLLPKAGKVAITHNKQWPRRVPYNLYDWIIATMLVLWAYGCASVEHLGVINMLVLKELSIVRKICFRAQHHTKRKTSMIHQMFFECM